MTRKLLRVPWIAVVAVLMIVPFCGSAGAKNKKAPEQFCRLSIVVLRDSDGTPIENAGVVIHTVRRDGRQKDDGFELKTNGEGRTAVQDIPYGTLRVQVVAHRMQTYGDDVEINQPKQEFVIRLKPPVAQVSGD